MWIEEKIITILATVAIVTSVFTGCSSKGTETKQSGQAGKSVKIGLSTDEGGLNDKSFNQAADTGIKKAVSEFGVDYKPVESAKKKIMNQT